MAGVRRALAIAAWAMLFIVCATAIGPSQRALTVSFAPDAPLRASPQPYAAPVMGVMLHEHADWPPAVRDEKLAAIAAAGFRIVRLDYFWAGAETAGVFDFTHAVTLVDAARAHGLTPLIVLAYGHPDYGDHTLPTPRAEDGFVRYAGAMAHALAGRGVRYEIWNEPNVPNAEPSRYLPPERFARIVTRASAAVHAADSTAYVISGGLSWTERPYLRRTLAAMRAAPPQLDAFGMHFYQGRAYPESAANDVARAHAALAPLLGALPIWNTEWGVSSATVLGGDSSRGGHDWHQRRLQAAMLARMFLVMWAAGAPANIWYEFEDHGEDPAEDFANYGLRDAAGVPKPAYAAARAFNRLADGRVYAGTYSALPAGLNAMRFDAPETTLVAVWCEAGARVRLRIPAARLTLAQNVSGDALPRQDGAEAQFFLSQSDGPLYLTFAR